MWYHQSMSKTSSYHKHDSKPKHTFTNEQIDNFIGRPTIKDLFSNKEKFYFYNRFEAYCLEQLKGEVSKNDIARTWNLITRKPFGYSNVKRLLFINLNLAYTVDYDYGFDSLGRKKESKVTKQDPVELSKIDLAVEKIDLILSLFLKPWLYKVAKYHSGILLWIHPKADKLIQREARPGNMVHYYTNNGNKGGTTMYY